MSKKRLHAMIDIENALQDVKINGLAELLYRKWFGNPPRLTMTCPEWHDSVDLGLGFSLLKEDMENLYKLKTLQYKISCVDGRIRLKFSTYDPSHIPDQGLSPFSETIAKDLLKNEQNITDGQKSTLSDFVFLVFKKLPVETIPTVYAKAPVRATLRFKLSSIIMNESMFRELFMLQECTNDIYSFKITTSKDMLELIVEFVFM